MSSDLLSLPLEIHRHNSRYLHGTDFARQLITCRQFLQISANEVLKNALLLLANDEADATMGRKEDEYVEAGTSNSTDHVLIASGNHSE